MNITFIVPTLDKGGSERVTSVLANRFSESQYNVKILTLYKSNSSYNLKSSVTIHSLGVNHSKNQLSLISKVKNFISRTYLLGKYFKDKDDIVIILSSDILNASLVVAKLFFGLKNKLILSCRSNPLKARKFFIRKIIYFFYKYGDAVVLQTKYLEEFMSTKVAPSRIFIINNPSEIKISSNQYLKNTKEIDFLSVGRINKVKNHLDIVKAVDIINKNKKKKINLHIVGRDDGGKKQILNYVSDNNLNDFIFFPGEVNDIGNYYKKANVLIHYSNYEGQSNVIIESQKYGIPCIVSDFDGVEYIIKNRTNGIIVKKSNPKLLAKEMQRLLFDKNLKKMMSKKSYNFSSKYDIEKIFKNWNELINSL